MAYRVQLVPKGEFAHREGLQVIGVQELERMLKGAKRHGRDIPVDFAHQSFEEGDAEAAGWVLLNSLEIRPNGLFGDIEWTEEAEDKVRGRKYRYLSPVFTHNPDWEEKGRLRLERVVSFGLTNYPNISAMKPLLNQIHMEGTMDELLCKLKKLLGMPTEPNAVEPAEVMDAALEKLTAMDELTTKLSELRDVLGISENAGFDELMAELEKRASATPPEDEPETDAKAAAEVAVMQEPATLPDGSKSEVDDLKKQLAVYREQEITGKVEKAIADGNLLPAQRQWATDYAKADISGFDKFLANSKPLISMGGVVIPERQCRPVSKISETQERVNSLLGISDEVFNNFNG